MINVILFILLHFLGIALHPYYVSIWDIQLDSRSKTVQITTKVFLEDVETGFKAFYGDKKWQWESKNDSVSKALDSLLLDFFQRQTDLRLNGEKVPLQFVGREVELDVMFVYLESKPWKTEPKKMDFSNTFLTKMISDQMNIVHVHYQTLKKSFLMHKSETNMSLQLAE